MTMGVSYLTQWKITYDTVLCTGDKFLSPIGVVNSSNEFSTRIFVGFFSIQNASTNGRIAK